MSVSRNIFPWFLYGPLFLTLASIMFMSWLSAIKPADRIESSCFNSTLIDSLNSQFSSQLSKALVEYSSTHSPFLQQITYDYYLAHVDKYIYDQSSHDRQLLHRSEHGSQYDGDILALFHPEAHFAFFPANFTLNRFQRTLQPDEVYT